jgi:hypothetical protein
LLHAFNRAARAQVENLFWVKAGIKQC